MFLANRDSRPLSAPTPSGIAPVELFLGKGSPALEVPVFKATRAPSAPELRELHDKRKGQRTVPVIAVVLWGDRRAALRRIV